MDLLTIKDVDFKYPKDTNMTIKDINLVLENNSMNVVIGPSGIGKSTLFHLIAGYDKPTSGTIEMNGNPVIGPSWERGVVFQDMALYPWLNVRKNIIFGPKVRGTEESVIDKRLDQLLQKTGLKDYKDKYTYELSGGLKQRVALAREFINQPPLLMLDESFSALDNFTRDEMHRILFNLWEECKNCVLIITHDLDEAIYLGQKIIVVNNHPGTITQEIINPFFRQNISDLVRNESYISYRENLLKLIKSTTSN